MLVQFYEYMAVAYNLTQDPLINLSGPLWVLQIYNYGLLPHSNLT